MVHFMAETKSGQFFYVSTKEKMLGNYEVVSLHVICYIFEGKNVMLKPSMNAES